MFISFFKRSLFSTRACVLRPRHSARHAGHLVALCAAVALGMCGCGNDDNFVFTNPAPIPGQAGPGTAQLAIYLVGSDLQSSIDAGAAELREMADGLRAMTTEERSRLDLLIAFGGANADGWRGIKWMNAAQLLADGADGIYGNETDPDSYLRRDDQADMSAPETLTAFLRYTATRPTAEKRFAVLWNHGAAYGGYGHDENFDHMLSLEELGSAFSAAQMPRLDGIGFDACAMACVEVAAKMQPYGRLMLASEELEPAHGWNYRYVVPALVRKPSFVDYAKGLADDYVNPESHLYSRPGKTLSVLDLDQIGNIVSALDDLGESLAPNLLPSAPQASGFVRAVVESQPFARSSDNRRMTVDLADFARKAQSFGATTESETAAVLEAVDEFVLYYRDDGSFQSVSGVAIIPPDLTSQRLAPESFPSSGWLELARAALRLANSDLSPPELLDLQLTAQGLEATFNDSLLTQVHARNGLRTPDGNLLLLDGSRATPLPSQDRFLAPAWDGQAFYLSFASNQEPQLLPLEKVGRPYTFSFDNTTLVIQKMEASIRYLSAEDPTPELLDGELTAHIEADGTLLAYEIRTRQLDRDGETVIDKSRLLKPGDQLQILTRSLNPGTAFALDRQQLGPDIVIGDAVKIFRGAVVPPAGTELAYALEAVDFSGRATVTDLQLLPTPAGGAAAPTAQVQLQLSGRSNISQNSFSSGAGAQIQAGDTTAAPKRFVARVTLPAAGGVTRSIQLTLPKPISELRAGTAFSIDGLQTTTAYAEAIANQPSAGKIFQAQSGRLVVAEVAQTGSTWRVVLQMDNVVLAAARGSSATGTVNLSGSARFSL